MRSKTAIPVLIAGGLLVLGVAWLARPGSPPGPDSRPAADERAPAAGSSRPRPSSASPAPKSLPSASSTQFDVARRLSAFDGDPDVERGYDSLDGPVFPSPYLLMKKVILVAAYPAESIAHYRAVLEDDSYSVGRKVAAVDGLGVLARGSHPEVRDILRSLLARGKLDPEVLEWATACLGRYYHGAGDRAVLVERAFAGSAAALEAVAYHPEVDVDALVRKHPEPADRAARLARRVRLLRDPHVRRKLGTLIRQEDFWAVEAAGRLGYAELAEDIRAIVPRIGRKILGVTPDDWRFWEAKERNADLILAVRALRRLGAGLTEMESRFADYVVLNGSVDEARRSAGLRKDIELPGPEAPASGPR